MLFGPGAAPNLSVRCISYPKSIATAGIYLAHQTSPAAGEGTLHGAPQVLKEPRAEIFRRAKCRLRAIRMGNMLGRAKC